MSDAWLDAALDPLLLEPPREEEGVPGDFLPIEQFDESPPNPPDVRQPPPRLERYIARHPYIEEPERHHLGPMDHICPNCGAASWADETPMWCCDAGKTEVGAPETPVDEADDTGEGRAETDLNEPVGPDEKAINDLLHSLKPGNLTLTDNCKEFRRHSALGLQYDDQQATRPVPAAGRPKPLARGLRPWSTLGGHQSSHQRGGTVYCGPRGATKKATY